MKLGDKCRTFLCCVLAQKQIVLLQPCPFALSFLCLAGLLPPEMSALRLMCILLLITLVLSQPHIRHFPHRLCIGASWCWAVNLFIISCHFCHDWCSWAWGGKSDEMTLKTALKRSILSWSWVLPETIRQMRKRIACFVKAALAHFVVEVGRLSLVFLQWFRFPGLWGGVWRELTEGWDLVLWEGYRKGFSSFDIKIKLFLSCRHYQNSDSVISLIFPLPHMHLPNAWLGFGSSSPTPTWAYSMQVTQ